MYGKVSEVVPDAGSSKPYVKYLYDASGNRIAKGVQPTSSSPLTWTYYVRDAQGNPMAVYERGTDSRLRLTERPLYGSDRLGMIKPADFYVDESGDVAAANVSAYNWIQVLAPTGASAAIFTPADRAITNVSNLQAGTYSFRFGVTDKAGNVSAATDPNSQVNVRVNQAPASACHHPYAGFTDNLAYSFRKADGDYYRPRCPDRRDPHLPMDVSQRQHSCHLPLPDVYL